MKTTYLLSELSRPDPMLFGGKATALWRLQEAGFRVPATLCISSAAYKQFVIETGLQEKMQLELHRKKFVNMRWEEIWDTALRIRNLFLRRSIPETISQEIFEIISENFKNIPVVVRSSAPEEDAAATSFAGLHESFVNVLGTEQILQHIKLVWASLWSDRALLYRQELDLDISKSSMAVIVQELLTGDASGVTFSLDPTDSAQGIVEAVYGLNQGLVDGAVEPDRWLIKRKDGTFKEHIGPRREKFMIPEKDGVKLAELPADKKNQAPLSPDEAASIYRMAKNLEEIFSAPQDVEWTKTGNTFYILQSRPITARQDGTSADKRGWYLSLHRSHENLKVLRTKIEKEHFPAMRNEAAKLAEAELRTLNDKELAEEIEKRRKIKEHWTGVYWDDFIPFAHGMRLFGKIYNDTMSPEDPFEFVELLSHAPLLSLERNAALEKIVTYVKQQPALLQSFAEDDSLAHADPEILKRMDEFIRQYGDPFCGAYGDKACDTGRQKLFKMITQMAETSTPIKQRSKTNGADKKKLETLFLGKFKNKEGRKRGADLLDLARASYRLRDDDNILLGKIEEQFILALQEGRKRLRTRGMKAADLLGENEVRRSLIDKNHKPVFAKSNASFSRHENHTIRARQLLGHPAGPGIGRGPARVVVSPEDLARFRNGEVLVCDAVDPNMTFVVPLAAGVVERRGGMLIHGAIIAREYGIACVTGVQEAATLIHTGDEVTVDGYLGIVTIGHTDRSTV